MRKRTINTMRFIASMVVLILLSACSTNNKSRPEPQKAASYNAQLGAEYLRKGRLNLANEKLQRALAQDPTSVDAHHFYALLQQKLGKVAVADQHFTKALELKPNPELHNNYGNFLCNNKHYLRADRQFKAAIADPLYRTPEYAYSNAGICAMDAGQLQVARQYFEKALARNPQFVSALIEMAQLYNQTGDFARAQAYLFRYNELVGDSPRSLRLCKNIHDKLGEKKTAEQCTSRLLTKFPNSKMVVNH